MPLTVMGRAAEPHANTRAQRKPSPKGWQGGNRLVTGCRWGPAPGSVLPPQCICLCAEQRGCQEAGLGSDLPFHAPGVSYRSSSAVAEPSPLPCHQHPSSWGQGPSVNPYELPSHCLHMLFPALACTQLTSAALKILKRAWIYS